MTIPIPPAPPRNATAPGNPSTAFYCSADWHLAPLGRYAVAIHGLMLRVQDEHFFFGSVPQMAEYFNAGENSIRRPLRKMRDLGFVMEIASRSGESTIYRALTHTEWAERHPGQCCVKRDATAFDAPPHEMEGGQNPSPFSDTPSKMEAHPSPERKAPTSKMEAKSPKQSPKKFPKDTDTAMQQKDAASLAARNAFDTFCQEMEERSAFDMVLWILYRAASIKSGAQIPRSVEYYREAKDNLIGQHDYDWEAITDSAEDKFNKHAYRLVEAKSPDLLAWLKEKARQLAERSAAAA